mmetsp:Transcript_31126/g.63720  ORF Transcript_31126/g.63720 Transcript_31126/m.63720 type:complete len:315 (-) Transcript_31126:170-1114(-)
MTQGHVLGVSAAITTAMQLTGFAFAYALKTETFYDVLGGLNYLAIAAYSAVGGDAAGGTGWTSNPRKVVATALFSASRSWLLIFLAWRAHERGGDARFDGVKDKFGLFLVYWIVQGVWVYLISLPVAFVNGSSSSSEGLTTLDVVAAAGWGLGIALEVLSDVQKALWVKAGRSGHFCRVGLWSYSRHPNYFGEMLQWWCAFALAYSSSDRDAGGYADPLWWTCALSPLFTVHILVNVGGTGLANAEGKGLRRYYEKCPVEYAEYRANTSILVPMVGYRHVPNFLKRTIFLDLKRYEYRPGLSDGGEDDGKNKND